MHNVNYYRLKQWLYDTADRLYKEDKLSRRDWTRYRLRIHGQDLGEYLLVLEKELKDLESLK